MGAGFKKSDQTNHSDRSKLELQVLQFSSTKTTSPLKNCVKSSSIKQLSYQTIFFKNWPVNKIEGNKEKKTKLEAVISYI